MNKIPWYYKAPPDGFSRYFIIKEIIKKLFTKQTIKILDVGGKSTLLKAMFSDEKLPYNLTVIDILPPDEETKNYNYIQGDAAKMEFKDQEFDAVVTTDVLEHIPDEKKGKFISECLRVAKDLVIIAAPFDSKETDYAENLANDFYKNLTGRDHPWLKEHFQAKKPKKQLIEKMTKNQKSSYLFFESNNLNNWILFLLLNFLPGLKPLEIAFLEEVNCFFNQNLLKSEDFDSPAYRQFYVIFKNKKFQKSFYYFFPIRKNFKIILDSKKKIYDFFNKIINNYSLLLSQKSAESENYKRELEQAKKQLNQLNSLTIKNQNLHQRINQTKTEIQNLETTLNMIKSAKFFKLWQQYNKIKKLIWK